MTPVESIWFYEPVEDRLLRQSRGGRAEVSLTPQQHRLVAYMAERNRAEGGVHVLCEREELIAAVWGDEPGHGPQDLAYLVHQLRSRLAAEPGDPPLIVNERGRGYRLLLRNTADLVVRAARGEGAPDLVVRAAPGERASDVEVRAARGEGASDVEVRAARGEGASDVDLRAARGEGASDLVVRAAPGDGASVARRSRRRLLAMGTAGVVALAVAGAVGVGLLNRPPEPILREGSRGDAVLALQRDLATAGFDPVYLDGQYGPLTARAVRQFQQDNGLVVDGEVGQETRSALQRVRDARRATPQAP